MERYMGWRTLADASDGKPGYRGRVIAFALALALTLVMTIAPVAPAYADDTGSGAGDGASPTVSISEGMSQDVVGTEDVEEGGATDTEDIVSPYSTDEAESLAPQADGDIDSGISGTCSWRITAENELIITPVNGVAGTLGDIEFWAPWSCVGSNQWKITHAVISPGVKAGAKAALFSSCKWLTSIEGLENLDTSGTTDMGEMFEQCISLQSLDLTSFDTSHVTNMANMFFDCRSLQSLDLTSFNTSQVTNMYDMFMFC